MNTDRLARHYAGLTPWERLPLIVAASARDDVVERERLARSAPTNGFRVPDYWGLAEGLRDLAKLYLLQQLDLAAFYWECTAFLESALPPGARPRPGLREREGRLGEAMRMLAYRFVIRADGWEELCAGLHVDPDFLLAGLPGSEGVRRMEEAARPLAFTAEEAIAYLRRTTDVDAPRRRARPRCRGSTASARAPTWRGRCGSTWPRSWTSGADGRHGSGRREAGPSRVLRSTPSHRRQGRAE